MKKGHFLRSFIPQKMPDRLVLFILRFLSLFSFIGRKTAEGHYRENEKMISAADFFMPSDNDGYIENQVSWKDVKFGRGKHSNMAYSGCEIIAVYNAILALGLHNISEVEPVSGSEPINESDPKSERAAFISSLIRDFEKRGAVRRGEFGVAPTAIRSYLKKKGYEVKRIKAVAKGEGQDKDRAVYIATYYNHSHDIFEQIHTACITKDENGFHIHNAYNMDERGRYSKKPFAIEGYSSLTEALENASERHPKLLYLMEIERPDRINSI